MAEMVAIGALVISAVGALLGLYGAAQAIDAKDEVRRLRNELGRDER